MKIKIGMPYYMGIELEVLKSIDALRALKSFEFDITRCKSSFLPNSRNVLLEGDYDYFCGLESDVTFTPEDFLTLFENCDDLIFGGYPSKCEVGHYEAGNFLKDYPGWVSERIPMSQKGIIPVDWSAAGFFMIKKSFVDKIGKPWFRCPDIMTPNGPDICEEAFGFCLKLREMGHQIKLACGLSTQHLLRKDEERELAQRV